MHGQKDSLELRVAPGELGYAVWRLILLVSQAERASCRAAPRVGEQAVDGERPKVSQLGDAVGRL